MQLWQVPEKSRSLQATTDTSYVIHSGVQQSLLGSQIKEEEIDQNICEAEAFIIRR